MQREAEVITYMTGVELGVKMRKPAPDSFSFLIPGLEKTQLPILPRATPDPSILKSSHPLWLTLL